MQQLGFSLVSWELGDFPLNSSSTFSRNTENWNIEILFFDEHVTNKGCRDSLIEAKAFLSHCYVAQ